MASQWDVEMGLPASRKDRIVNIAKNFVYEKLNKCTCDVDGLCWLCMSQLIIPAIICVLSIMIATVVLQHTYDHDMTTDHLYCLWETPYIDITI